MEKDGLNQVAEEILVFKYDENTRDSIFYGILGDQVELKNAMVMEVNMMPKRHDIVIVQSPLVSTFVSLVKKINNNSVSKKDVETLQKSLEDFKTNL